jgi:hypothetical protein
MDQVIMKSAVIFLTGCINPNGMSFTKLLDPDVRLKQYIAAIKFYLNNTNLKIVFVDNSGVNLKSYFDDSLYNSRLEILSFLGNNYPKNLGKGYGEMLILEYALKSSVFIAKADFIFKITGRLQVRNIKALVNQYEKNLDLQIIVDLKGMLFYADSRFWGGAKSFFSLVVSNKYLVNDSQNKTFEQALSKAVCIALLDNYKFSQLYELPRYSGVSGTLSQPYNSNWFHWYPRNLKQKLKYYLMKV